MKLASHAATKLKSKSEKDSLFKSLFDKVMAHQELIAAILSGAIILLTWTFSAFISSTLWVVLHIVAFVIGGYNQARDGIIDTIETKELNVELLMIFAAIGSAAIGYWTEGAILIFIFSLAGALETYTLNKSNKEISSLMKLQPEEAVKINRGNEETVPVSDLVIGDHIFIRASERIPADGTIVRGATSVDESAITGESIPVAKENKNDVFAGTVALDGSIVVEITKPASETLFQKIISMVQSAKDEKSPAQLFIEKFEGTYVKIVLVAVVLMMFVPYLLFSWTLTESIYRAMVLLVVASPCALVASIMPATLSAISNSARKGVLFKGGIHAERLSQMKIVAFDKTGTLTYGTHQVTDALFNPDYDRELILKVVGAIESESTHPIGKAITMYSTNELETNQFKVDLVNMTTVSGKGVHAHVNGEKWIVGNPGFVGINEAYGFQNGIGKKLAQEGKTVIYVQYNDKVVALFALKDTIRDEAKETIKALHKRGIKTLILTGDNELTAKSVAEEAGITDYIADCLPDQKVNTLKKLMKEHNGQVAMVGDGINDAPALATADLGVAMGGGTDVALETADIVLMQNDLSKINEAIRVSERMNRIVKQNIFFSLAVIATLIVSNFFQAIDLPLGVIGHEGSTILVILNGLRLLKE